MLVNYPHKRIFHLDEAKALMPKLSKVKPTTRKRKRNKKQSLSLGFELLLATLTACAISSLVQVARCSKLPTNSLNGVSVVKLGAKS